MADHFEYVQLEDFMVQSLDEVDFQLFDPDEWQALSPRQQQRASRRGPLVVDGVRYLFEDGDDEEIGYLYSSPGVFQQIIVRKHLPAPNLVLCLHASLVQANIRIVACLLSGNAALTIEIPAGRTIMARDVITRVREACAREFGLATKQVRMIASQSGQPFRASDGLVWKPAGSRRYVFKPKHRINSKSPVGLCALRKHFLPIE